MSDFVLDEVVGRKYLLGELSVDDRGQVEECAFLEPRSFELLRELENELIDDYVTNDLTPGERHLFETHFLSQPGRRSDLRIAVALQAYAPRKEAVAPVSNKPIRAARSNWLSQWFSPRLRLPLPVWGVLGALFLIATVLLGIRLFRAAKTPAPIQANQENKNSDQQPDRGTQALTSTPTPASKQATPNRPNRPESSSVAQAFLLVPGGLARGDNNITKIPVRSALLTFDLPLIDKPEYRNYQVVLEHVSDVKELRRWTGLRPQSGSTGKVVRVTLNSQILKAHQDNYRFVLAGVASDATVRTLSSYYFTPVD